MCGTFAAERSRTSIAQENAMNLAHMISVVVCCFAACGTAPPSPVSSPGGSGQSARSCQIEDQVFLHGATNVPDLTSCNTCTCQDGEITSCTEINCPSPCAAGKVAGKRCSACGPASATCESVKHACLQACEDSVDCQPGSQCIDGACIILCE